MTATEAHQRIEWLRARASVAVSHDTKWTLAVEAYDIAARFPLYGPMQPCDGPCDCQDEPNDPSA